MKEDVDRRCQEKCAAQTVNKMLRGVYCRHEINPATTISEIRKAPNLGTPSSCYRREKTHEIICGTLQTKVVLCIGNDLFCTYDTGLQLLSTQTFKSVVDALF